jgi:glycosyltransferase involved in cell wall biosynthesis
MISMPDLDTNLASMAKTPPLQPRTIWICSYLPHSRGAGVERFVDMIADVAAKMGLSPKVLDLSTFHVRRGALLSLRYLTAWRIGRTVNRLAKPGDIVVCNNFFSWNARSDRSFVVYHGTDKGRAVKNRKNMTLLRGIAVRTIGSYLERRTGIGRVVVAVSSTAKEEVEHYYGLRVQRVIPNAVDLSLFAPSSSKTSLRRSLGLPNDKFLILFVGTSDPRKGLRWILEELKPRMHENQHLVLRCDLPAAPQGVTVVNRLPIKQLADLYRACDVLLFPTSYEGCSFTLVEALASGLPAITSPAGSGRDLLDVEELRPYVIDEIDPDEYMKCINRLQSSEDEFVKVSSAARAFAEKHHNLTDFERAYSSLIAELVARA